MRDYKIIDETGVIYYDENGVRCSFLPDPANPEYQTYLSWLENPDDFLGGTLS